MLRDFLDRNYRDRIRLRSRWLSSIIVEDNAIIRDGGSENSQEYIMALRMRYANNIYYLYRSGACDKTQLPMEIFRCTENATIDWLIVKVPLSTYLLAGKRSVLYKALLLLHVAVTITFVWRTIWHLLYVLYSAAIFSCIE